MTENVAGQMSIADLGISFGRTCQEPLHREHTEEQTSRQSSKRSSKSSSRKQPISWCLTRDGLHRESSPTIWVDSPLLGEYTTHSFGEYPNEENVSVLSQILQDEVPETYYLSARACQGILNRAERRGKELPKILKEALVSQAGQTE